MKLTLVTNINIFICNIFIVIYMPYNFNLVNNWVLYDNSLWGCLLNFLDFLLNCIIDLVYSLKLYINNNIAHNNKNTTQTVYKFKHNNNIEHKKEKTALSSEK